MSAFKIHKQYLAQKVTPVIVDLLLNLRMKGLLTIREKNDIDSLPDNSKKAEMLLEKMELRTGEIYKFVECLQEFPHLETLVHIWNTKGVVVKLTIANKNSPNSKLLEQKIVSEVNRICNETDSNKCEAFHLSENSGVDILEALWPGEPGIVLWIWCKNYDAFHHLQASKIGSEDILHFISKLFDSILKSPGIIEPTSIQIEAGNVSQHHQTMEISIDKTDDRSNNTPQTRMSGKIPIFRCKLCFNDNLKERYCSECGNDYNMEEYVGGRAGPDSSMDVQPIQSTIESRKQPPSMKSIPLNIDNPECSKTKSTLSSIGSRRSLPEFPPKKDPPRASFSIPERGTEQVVRTVSKKPEALVKPRRVPPPVAPRLSLMVLTKDTGDNQTSGKLDGRSSMESAKQHSQTSSTHELGQLERQMARMKIATTSVSEVESPRTRNTESSSNPILATLGMENYYPKKLSWKDVIQIGNSKNACVNVVKNLMRFDHTAPFSVFSNLNAPIESSIERNDVEIDDTPRRNFSIFRTKKPLEKSNSANPLDIMNIIYNCCDHHLLQKVMEKMFTCQLSIPLIFPDKQNSTWTFLLWSLRGITPEFEIKDGGQVSASLVEIPQPIVSVIRVGSLKKSKSKLLNDVLRPTNHTTFIHRDCENGKSPRFLSDGTVEATWYLPSGKKTDELSKMFCLLNLRGDSVENPKHTQFLFEVSSTVFLMIDINTLHDKNYTKLLNIYQKSKAQIVICLVTDCWDTVKGSEKRCDECIRYFEDNEILLHDVMANWNAAELDVLNADAWKKEFVRVLSECLKESNLKQTVEMLADHARQYVNIDEDVTACSEAFNESQQILTLMNAIAVVERKTKLLPLQGTYWEKWTQLQKEQYRETVSENLIDNFIAEKESDQETICKDQLALFEKNCAFIKNIYCHLINSESIDKMQYFVAWVRIMLDRCCRDILPGLQNKYHAKRDDFQKCLASSKDKASAEQLQQQMIIIAKEMTNSSFGIEHIFREFCQIYQAAESLSATEHLLHHYATNMPVLMAKLVLNGTPLELMDGDVAFVPVAWVKAVFREIQKLVGKEKHVFVISVVGVQSSGKSTMLNAMFGLQFAVSAGRCTKGVYCQMIPVYKHSLGVDYDYILVIDTEGLRAPELLQEKSQSHDNELATFAIGLGNVTIVNIKGENSSEIHEVLQIVTHAMIRIKFLSNVPLNPSCVFIHQNVSAVNAKGKMQLGQETLLQRLDDVTMAAAEQEQVPNVQQFKHVINYDPSKHAIYMPDLWGGNPPMAPVNPGYIEEISDVKNMLINDISKQSSTVTIESFSEKLQNLWEAILGENFVFNFRNNEEVRAYEQLDVEFSKWLSTLKNGISELESSLKHEISSSNDVNGLRKKLESKISLKIVNIMEPIENKLKQYFEKDTNKRIIGQWRAQYMKQLETVFRDETDRMKRELNELCSIREMQISNNLTVEGHRNQMKDQILKKAQHLKASRSTLLSDKELYNYFQDIWNPFVSTLCSSSIKVDTTECVLAAFEVELFRSFNSHLALLKEVLDVTPLKQLEGHSFDATLTVVSNDLDCQKIDNIIGKVVNFFKKHINQTDYKSKCAIAAQNHCRTTVDNIRSYVDKLSGGDFQPGNASAVVRMIMECFEGMNNKAKYVFNFSHTFQIRFAVDTCKCAANKFIDIRNTFLEKTDPLVKVKEYELSLFNTFKETYNKCVNSRDTAQVFVKYFEDWIKDTIWNDSTRLIASEIMKDGKHFSSKQLLVKKVLIDLAEEHVFGEFMKFINDPNNFLCHLIQRYEMDWKRKNKRMIVEMVEKERKKYFQVIVQALGQMRNREFSSVEEYVKKLRKYLKDKMFIDPRILVSMHITDFKEFTACLLEAIHSQSSQTSASISDTVQSLSSVSILTDKLLGCSERCPFCTAPCYCTDAVHAGDHIAMQHYPNGVIGGIDMDSKKLKTYCCNAVIKSDMMFCYDYRDPETCREKFKNYKKIYRSWEIPPDRSGKLSRYWKWFMVRYHDNLMKYYQAGAADIPNEWRTITWQQAKDSL